MVGTCGCSLQPRWTEQYVRGTASRSKPNVRSAFTPLTWLLVNYVTKWNGSSMSTGKYNTWLPPGRHRKHRSQTSNFPGWPKSLRSQFLQNRDRENKGRQEIFNKHHCCLQVAKTWQKFATGSRKNWSARMLQTNQCGRHLDLLVTLGKLNNYSAVQFI